MKICSFVNHVKTTKCINIEINAKLLLFFFFIFFFFFFFFAYTLPHLFLINFHPRIFFPIKKPTNITVTVAMKTYVVICFKTTLLPYSFVFFYL